jgi:CheY-like chemotaxis protein
VVWRVAQIGPSPLGSSPFERSPAGHAGAAAGIPDFLHDLANLLTAISGSLELILSRPGDERHERWARNALEAAEQAAHLAEKHHLTQVEAEPVPGAVDARLPRLARASGPRRRILVVDDEKSVRRTVADILLALGHEPVEAEGGVAALALIGEAPLPDLFIIDFAMPGMTGAELALSLLGRAPQARILFMSGGRGDRAVMQAIDPTIPILRKPFHSSDLAASVAAALAEAVSAVRRN